MFHAHVYTGWYICSKMQQLYILCIECVHSYLLFLTPPELSSASEEERIYVTYDCVLSSWPTSVPQAM